MEENQGNLYRLKEVAAYLKVSRQTIYNYIKAGKLKTIKLAGKAQYRVSERDLLEFIKEYRND